MKNVSSTRLPVVGETYVIALHPAQKGIEEKSQVKTAKNQSYNQSEQWYRGLERV